MDVTDNVSRKFRSSSRSSIFSCETMAILSALKAGRNPHRNEIVIFSDSLSVLLALESAKKKEKPYLIWEICKESLELERNSKRISLFWIPAHVGIQGNERADQEAREACVSGLDTDLLMPGSDLRSGWKDRLFDDLHEWALERGNQKGKYFFQWFFKPSRKPWFLQRKGREKKRRNKNKAVSFDRKEVVSINRLRSGHTSLLESLWLHNIVDSPQCDCGMGVQSANHIFWQCPIFEIDRKTIIC